MERKLKEQEDKYILREEACRVEMQLKEDKLKEKLRKKISRLEYQLSALCSKSWVPHTESEASEVEIDIP